MKREQTLVDQGETTDGAERSPPAELPLEVRVVVESDHRGYVLHLTAWELGLGGRSAVFFRAGQTLDELTSPTFSFLADRTDTRGREQAGLLVESLPLFRRAIEEARATDGRARTEPEAPQ